MANKLKQWIDEATVLERTYLLRKVSISLSSLRWHVGGYRNGGKVNVDPELAKNIELAAAKIHRDGLPVLKRTDMCVACSRCEFAKGK